jgi:hypothetical protein
MGCNAKIYLIHTVLGNYIQYLRSCQALRYETVTCPFATRLYHGRTSIKHFDVHVVRKASYNEITLGTTSLVLYIKGSNVLQGRIIKLFHLYSASRVKFCGI